MRFHAIQTSVMALGLALAGLGCRQLNQVDKTAATHKWLAIIHTECSRERSACIQASSGPEPALVKPSNQPNASLGLFPGVCGTCVDSGQKEDSHA
jgi:hypothetical protein